MCYAVLLLMACGSISYSSLLRKANNSDKNIVLLFIYQIPSSRIQEILNSNNKEISVTNELKNIAQKQGLEIAYFKQQQLKRVVYSNQHLGETTTKGLFTDRGRIYVKYGEPDTIIDTDDEKYGKIQTWNYNNSEKSFIFLTNEELNTFKLVNVYDED